MTDRFSGLKKIPDQPASRLLAVNNAKLKTKIAAPASAPAVDLLAELQAAMAWVDMLRLLSVCLPPREVVWWACLAGRDIVGEEETSICLKTAEAWVFGPTDENRLKLQQVLENESSGDKAALCATAAYYAPGTLGLGEMANQPAPVGVVAACAFGINLKTLKIGKAPDMRFQLAIDRALDIARGGNGAVELPKGKEAAQAPEPAAQEGT